MVRRIHPLPRDNLQILYYLTVSIFSSMECHADMAETKNTYWPLKNASIREPVCCNEHDKDPNDNDNVIYTVSA